jgi:hypothetical protein
MAASDQQILDAARDRLLAILTGGVAEFREGNDEARMLEIDRLESLIEKYEGRVATVDVPVFRPVRCVDL